ncbi:MAG TPA: 3'-5' exonuclease, partial [Longimicrobiales bacterium]|nr:3'-5' exonuclease [Longimicrobiales bacterium]
EAAPVFDLMPASHLLPGCRVAVLDEDGKLVADEVISREISDVTCDVFDLSVFELRNYVAGGICVHNSIYGWRGADLRNILDFEEAFPGAHVVRLEQNYRSTERILDAANAVIRQNVNRKGKTLRTERSGGEVVTVVETADETDEARWIVDEIGRSLEDEPERSARDFAILYRTNAQSRALEDAFRRGGLPYQIVGGVRFYERREIQDVVAYLRLISNPRDADAFDRAVGWPRRGVGAVTQERLTRFADREGIPLLEAAERATDAEKIPTAGARSLEEFAALIRKYSGLAARLPVGELLEDLVEELDVLKELRDEGPDGEDRAENVKELIAGALDFDAELLEEMEELPEDRFTELDLFLQRVALVADIDRHDPDADAVTLMTLHNAKGLEFPFVFIAGMEDGLFPLARAYDEPAELEEERRLFYVGITRAEEKVWLTHARQRRRAGDYMYGHLSSFVDAIPPDLLEERTSPRLQKTTGFDGFGRRRARGGDDDATGVDPSEDEDYYNQDLPRLVKGERVSHPTFGPGTVVEVSGFGREMKVTVKFDTVGRKKLMVRYAGLEKDF